MGLERARHLQDAGLLPWEREANSHPAEKTPSPARETPFEREASEAPDSMRGFPSGRLPGYVW